MTKGTHGLTQWIAGAVTGAAVGITAVHGYHYVAGAIMAFNLLLAIIVRHHNDKPPF